LQLVPETYRPEGQFVVELVQSLELSEPLGLVLPLGQEVQEVRLLVSYFPAEQVEQDVLPDDG